MRDKRLVAVLVALAMCALALVGCGTAEEESSETSAEAVTAGDVFVLPEIDAEANNAGLALVGDRCVGCHAIDEVNSARKDAFEWERTVDEMIAKGAKLSPEERAAVVAYLGTRNDVLKYGQSTLRQNCMLCHTTTRTEALQLDWAGWNGVVDRMVSNGAEVDDAERDIIIEWLLIRGAQAQ